MAFALVNFYEENAWDIIPTPDVILNDGVANVSEGMKTLVYWRGKGRTTQKVPAEISTISDNKDFLMRMMRGDVDTPRKQGKGCRKRVSNTKYAEVESDEDEKPGPSAKRGKSSNKKEESKRSDNLTSLLKSRHRQEIEHLDLVDDENEHDSDTVSALQQEVKALTEENCRLREQISNSQDLQMSLKKLKRYVGKLGSTQVARIEPNNSTSSGSSSPCSSYTRKLPSSPSLVHSPASRISASLSPASLPVSPPSTMPPSPSPVSEGDQDFESREAEAGKMIYLGPGLSLPPKVFKRIKPRKVGSYVANIMAATLSREYMATHSYKGQKAKNGQVKPKLDPEYTNSMIAHCKSIKYTDMAREVITEDIVKAIKYKLNNEEQGWKKQREQEISKPGCGENDENTKDD